MALLLIKLNLRSVWRLFCLFFFTYKAVSSSAEFKNQESIVIDSPTLDYDGDASVITNRRAEQFSNLYKTVHNFSATTKIKPPFAPSESVASLQWIGSPPSQVNHVHLQLRIAFSTVIIAPFTAFDYSVYYGQRKSGD